MLICKDLVPVSQALFASRNSNLDDLSYSTYFYTIVPFSPTLSRASVDGVGFTVYIETTGSPTPQGEKLGEVGNARQGRANAECSLHLSTHGIPPELGDWCIQRRRRRKT